MSLKTCLKSLLVLTFFIAFSNLQVKAQNNEEQSESGLTWNTEKLDTGIYWKSYRGDDLFESHQSINLIEIFLDSIGAEFKMAFMRDSLLKTSEFAEENNAIAAVNGSFFRDDTGGPLVFLKADGEIIGSSPDRNGYHESGGLVWSDNESIRILKQPDNGWKNAEFQNILSAGPLLIFESNIQNFNNDPFHQNRHPRTAVATTNDRRLYLVTIDGRSFQSYGMTISELALFLMKLEAEYALNLDGGGSTTMWIKEMEGNGIVNFPSDNLEFDHEGERKVSNVLLIIPSD